MGLGIEQTFVLTGEEQEVFGINLFTWQPPPAHVHGVLHLM